MLVINHGGYRFFIQGLAALALMCLVQVSAARQSVSISPSVVLVLKLVSSTHVKPTTGIVISDDGLVLVSAGFASSEGEIIVLDGGTDIVGNGRPARVLKESGSGELAVLSVDGLQRPGITFSDNALQADSKLRFEAFPPAEEIAKGAKPLLVPVDILRVEPDAQVSIAPETPLPLVSGAIMDPCGFLAGFSLSKGPQSPGTASARLTLLNDEIMDVLEELQITPLTAGCASTTQPSMAPVAAGEAAGAAPSPKQPPEQTQATEATETTEPAAAEPVAVEMEASPRGDAEASVDPVARATGESVPDWRTVPLWIVLAAIIFVAALIWKAVHFFRPNASVTGQKAARSITRDVQPASDEPVTAPLDIADSDSFAKPRSAPLMDLDIPGLAERPEGCDGVLLVEGMLDADTAFRRFCFVNSNCINAVIGRGDADIAIEHAAISRAHVRLESDQGHLTLSDLGSRNGTYIGDIPCLPGEVLYVEETDDIYLGDLKLTVRVVKPEAEWA